MLEYLMPLGFLIGVALGVLFESWKPDAFAKYGGWVSGAGIVVCGVIIAAHRLLTGAWY